MDHLRSLGNRIAVSIPPDNDGFTGRECPNQECEGYFKIELGTGLQGENLSCHCPYCGHSTGHDHFFTQEQIKYFKSIAMRQIADAIHKDLKKLEFDSKPRGVLSLGVSLKVSRSRRLPIHYYKEKQLETEIICSNCTLRYSVFGVFAFCPDCGQHNSLQILERNLEIVTKMLDLSIDTDAEITEKLVENALEDCVSAFDGFAREICLLHAAKATNPDRAKKLSFQDMNTVKRNLARLFHIELDRGVVPDQWQEVGRCFQKRHLVAHKMGVVDAHYVRKSGDTLATLGQKITIYASEVRNLLSILPLLAKYLRDRLERPK